MSIRRKSRRQRLASAGAAATAALAFSASANADTPHVLGVGPTYTHSWDGGLIGNAMGVEASWVWYPKGMWLVGPIVQGQLAFGVEREVQKGVTVDPGLFGRSLVGVEVGFAAFGMELGWTVRGPSKITPVAHGIHWAPYLSCGVLSLAPGFTYFPAEAQVEGRITLALKIPVYFSKDILSSVYGFRGFSFGSGRPLRVNEGCALPALVLGVLPAANRGNSRPDVAAIDPATRVALAMAWARDGQLEYASVAVFARLSLELLAHGAPAALVGAAHRAALDEVRHAQMCMALASAYAGVSLQAGGLPEAVAPIAERSLGELAIDCLIDGCCGEGLAAAEAHEASLYAEDPAVRRTLVRIARDEVRHAKLAARMLRFCLSRGGAAVAGAVGRALEGPAPRPMVSTELYLPAHGRLAHARRTLLSLQVWEQCRLRWGRKGKQRKLH